MADGYTDSDPTRGVSFAPLYSVSQSQDLTDLDLYASVTSDADAFSWGNDWGFSDGQEFHILNTANIGIISVQNSKLNQRYSYAKGIGLANNYGYTYGSNVGSPYSFAEYYLYQNHSLTDINTKIKHNPTTSTFTFPSQANGALKAVKIYEPYTLTVSVEVSSASYATYVNNAFDLDFTDSDIKAYKVKVNAKGEATLTKVNEVPAATPVLLYYEGGTTEDIPVMEGAAAVSDNDLVAGTGVAIATTDGEYTNMILNKIDDVVGFYFANDQIVASNRAYLHILTTLAPDAITGSKSIRIVVDDEATGVGAVQGEGFMVNEVLYNMAGIQVDENYKGIVINRKGEKRFNK